MRNKTFRNEGSVKSEVKKLFKKYGVYYYMPVPSFYSRSGVPDFICCINGKFFSVETKYKYNKPTDLQDLEMSKIIAAGGRAFVINERNIDTLEDYLFKQVVRQEIDGWRNYNEK